MTVGILAEKPSAAKKFAAALGGMSGTYQGTDYVITAARGHLYELVKPDAKALTKALTSQAAADPDKIAKYKSWAPGDMPWNPEDFAWVLGVRGDAGDVISRVVRDLSKCSEIVIATDIDPSGEGGGIAANILVENDLTTKKVSRMYFTDESAKSVQKAFVDRKSIPNIWTYDEFKMHMARSRWDMLSMQWTRLATSMCGVPSVLLRQGRLKTMMVVLYGNGSKAYHEYKKIPFYTNKFRDENGVIYSSKDEPQFKTRDEVPNVYHPSKVTFDGSENKRIAPPKLIDLAALGTILGKEGFKASQVSSTYQKMYEAEIVSYPRTEDKTITPEQFTEMLPLVDKIAAVVGANASLLTHREPRKTHVKAQGAHGANRPGPKVPASLDAIESTYGALGRRIYEVLAKSYLAMLAEDYVYEQQRGHVTDYPAFTGTANIPKELGYRAIFDDSDDEEPDENLSTKGLGENADPFVHEGFPPRPPKPTQGWLMKQLEKYDIGTGATRLSTFADVTNEKSVHPLLVVKRGALSFAPEGETSYAMMIDTSLADPVVTKRLFDDMKLVGKGEKTIDDVLSDVATMVKADIPIMERNASKMHADRGTTPKMRVERAEGTWKGEQVSFSKTWGGYTFSDEQVKQLLAGETIRFIKPTDNGGFTEIIGRLDHYEFKGEKRFGFTRDMSIFPTAYLQHTFTADEAKRLQAGEMVDVEGYISSKGKPFSAPTTWKDGKFEFHFPERDNTFPEEYKGHRFTVGEASELKAGKIVEIKGLKKNDGSGTYDAPLSWKAGRFSFHFPERGGSGGKDGPRKGAAKKTASRPRRTS